MCQSMLLVLAFTISYGLPKSGLENLALIPFHMPTAVPSSAHLFKKNFEMDYSIFSYYYFCPTCNHVTDGNGIQACIKWQMTFNVHEFKKMTITLSVSIWKGKSKNS